MKAESNLRPEKFQIENINNERCDLVLYDNITEVIDEGNTKYVFDIYRLNICYSDGIELKIENNYNHYLKAAKDKEYNTLASDIRKQRDKLLQDSDKEMCIDRLKIDFPTNLSMTNIISCLKQFFESLSKISNGDMARYRQELRDITKQADFPYNVIFPNIPNKED